MYILQDHVREYFRKRLGIVIKDCAPKSIRKVRTIYQDLNCKYLITIGDIVTENVCKYWKIPNIAIIDFKSQRRPYRTEVSSFTTVLILENPRSTISSTSEDMICKVFKLMSSRNLKILIVVYGEEDLLAIPSILYSPSRSLVLYGLFDELIVIPTCIDYKLAVLKLYSLLIRKY